MKKHLIALFAGLILFQFASQAQDSKKTPAQIPFDTAQAFVYYKALFAEKGVTELTNGMHKVVVTLRHNQDSTITREYYEGLIRIENSKFVPPMKLKGPDGKYFTPKDKIDMDSFQKYHIPAENKIVHGMSPTWVTKSGFLADVFVVDILKK
jgi:hypothetical protein